MSDASEETRERLRAAADAGFPAAWIPEEAGDEIAGVITAVRPSVGTSYGPVPVVELKELGASVRWSLWLIHTVLRREFVRQRPAVGETILVRYLGRVKPEGGGAAYEAYKLVVDRPDQGDEIDWTAIAARYDPDVAAEQAAGQNRPDEPPPYGDQDVPY
jgi:hypothetical protein